MYIGMNWGIHCAIHRGQSTWLRLSNDMRKKGNMISIHTQRHSRKAFYAQQINDEPRHIREKSLSHWIHLGIDRFGFYRWICMLFDFQIHIIIIHGATTTKNGRGTEIWKETEGLCWRHRFTATERLSAFSKIHLRLIINKKTSLIRPFEHL